MLHTSKKGNKGVYLFIMCALALALCFPMSVFAQQPKPHTPQVKSPDVPKAPASMESPNYIIPAPPEQSHFYSWLGTRDKEKPRIHVGALEIHPYGSIEEKYDTNVYLEPKDRQNEDWITDYRTGIALKMPFVPSRGEDYVVEGFYHADFIEFLHQNKLSRVDHTAHGSISGNLPSDVGFKVTEDFLRTQDPPNNERTLLTKRWWNMFDARMNYTREKIKVEGAYTQTTNVYDLYSNINYNDYMGTGAIYYLIGTKTWLLAESNAGRIMYNKSPTNSNSQYYQIRVGVEGKIAPKLEGTLKFGYRYQDYSRSDSTDYDALAAYGNVKYDVTQRTSLKLYGERKPIESTYGSNSYYIDNMVGATFDHLLMRRLWLTGGAWWAYDEYPTDSQEGDTVDRRTDALWGTGIGLKYEVKDWLFLNTGYNFKQRDSVFHNYNYNDHQITMRGSVAF